jgi:hypothetical protein
VSTIKTRMDPLKTRSTQDTIGPSQDTIGSTQDMTWIQDRILPPSGDSVTGSSPHHLQVSASASSTIGKASSLNHLSIWLVCQELYLQRSTSLATAVQRLVNRSANSKMFAEQQGRM